MKIRGKLIATKSRVARWHKDQDTSCDSCGRRETLGHILQVCPRSWGERIKRHDQISAFTSKKARSKPIIRIYKGIRKPDLVLAKKEVAFVLDTIICSENASLSSVHQQKIGLRQNPFAFQQRYNNQFSQTRSDEVVFGSITIK